MRPPASANPALAAAIRAACERLIALEAELNRLDASAGDGDTGSTAAAGARSLIAALPALPLADPAATCRRIGDILAASMGGSSGVLLSIFFTATGQKLADGAPLAAALGEGLDRIRFYGGAAPGDRTLIDALAPAIDALRRRRPRRRRPRRRGRRRRHRRDGPRPRRPRRLPRRHRPDRHPRRRRPGRRRRLRRAQVSKTSSGNRASAAARRRAITS